VRSVVDDALVGVVVAVAVAVAAADADVDAAAADDALAAAPTTADPTTNLNKLDRRNAHTTMIPDCIINCGIWDTIIHVVVDAELLLLLLLLEKK